MNPHKSLLAHYSTSPPPLFTNCSFTPTIITAITSNMSLFCSYFSKIPLHVTTWHDNVYCERKRLLASLFVLNANVDVTHGACIWIGIHQVIGTGVWFVLEPPGTRQWFPDPSRKSDVILKCRVKDASFLVSLVYNMFLITTCTVYAVKTRKIPENFNESKFIGFTMYTTCIIWLAFVPLFFGTGSNYEIQITTLCVSISLSAYVALFCLFSPKIYIIIFHPDKNVRKLTMNSATYKRALTSSTVATASNHGKGEKYDFLHLHHLLFHPLLLSSPCCIRQQKFLSFHHWMHLSAFHLEV